LLESELFGHVRGAYTDAKGERTGLFVQANRGTLFLDEIGELPIDVQPKLLRALQERVVRPLGSNTEIAFDARIVTATNRDLEADVDEKRFREDLYYRINVVRIDLPPLRERGKDVVAIARAILDRLPHGKKIVLPLAVVEKLVAYNWPGNVRELENCMERSTALTRGEMAVEDLPDRIATYRPPDGSVITAVQEGELVTLEQLERRYIVKVLAVVNGHKTRAASILGLDRKTLYRKLEAAAGEAPAR
jgi:two-component system response regulator HydG